MIHDTTPTVDAIGKIHLEGNIIPHTWYQAIQTPAGLPDFPAITILAEIVYWYRPTYDQDESSGQLIAVRKKFRADKLQRTANALANKFGFSQRQARDALQRLEQRGLICREYRTVELLDGIPVNNVLFLEPVPSAIDAITHSRTPSPEISEDTPHNSVTPPSKFRHITDISSEITPETKKTDPPVLLRKTSPPMSNESQKEKPAPFDTNRKQASLTPEELIALYNDLTPQKHHKIRTLSPGRRKKALTYLKTFPDRSFWEAAFHEVHQSAFLRGERNGDGHMTFHADFDWFLSKGKDGTENCLKVQEGKYRDALLPPINKHKAVM